MEFAVTKRSEGAEGGKRPATLNSDAGEVIPCGSLPSASRNGTQ
jgi:hypothetical protein